MIPRTFPSTFALNGQQQMVVHFLTSVDGLERWSDYIPVKLEQGGPENSYSGCIDVVAISELTPDTQAWKEYIPVHVDDEATDTWTVNNVGYIPYNYALFAEAAMQLDLTNGADLDYRVTFNRTTNATVTGPDGLIAYAEHNLLRFSESFDNAVWLKINAAVTANSIAAPDGTLTADKWIEDTATTTHQIQQGSNYTSGVTYTYSFYAKKGERSIITMFENVLQGIEYAKFNLNTGVATTSGSTFGWTRNDVSMTPVGDDWYRCVVTATPGSNITNNAFITRMRLDNGTTTSYAGDGTSGLFLWGAQLEQSSIAREYYPTTVKNLLGFTEHFDNAAWTKSNASISATKVDDIYGEPFAQKLVENTELNSRFISQSASKGATVGIYTFSAYVKDAGRSNVRLLVRGATGGGNGALVDLSIDGSVIGTAPTTFGSGFIAGNFASQDMGNGWYRVSFTATTGTETLVVCTIQLLDSSFSASYTGDGTSGIFIFGAQLSDSASVDPYVYQPVAAPASTAYYGPRFDYDPVTLAPKGLLIEEQRTNLLLRSEEFDNAYWNKPRCVVLPNLIISPDGTLTADKVATNVGIQFAPNVARLLSITAGAAFTLSVFAKAGELNFIKLCLSSGANTGAFFNLTTGVVGSVNSGYSASIQPAGNGWFRCAITFTTTQTSNFAFFSPATEDNNPTVDGDGFSGIFIWGAQLE